MIFRLTFNSALAAAAPVRVGVGGRLAPMLFLCLLLAAEGRHVAAQEGPRPATLEGAESDPIDARRALTAGVAKLWAVAPESVRIELPPDAPALVDSVAFEPGSGDRWITTFVVDGHVVRRFVRVGHEQGVAVAASAMPRDHVVRSEDLTTGSRIVWGPPAGVPPDPEGWVVHRPIDAGDALVEPAVRPPLLVRGGDEVEAVFARGGVVLNIRAEALSSARSGELVAVRMPSGKRMDGRAVAPGRVVLDTGANR
ncbi:MAG: flagellar basal body P-ring formation protein FlgA [Gemmatimonadetes bacterium]|nr:flagellar basal body P-ring formation protein FlgA [Gemmatimonadota bacterium]